MTRTFLYTGNLSFLFGNRFQPDSDYSEVRKILSSQLFGSRKFKGHLQADIKLFLPFTEDMKEKKRQEKNGTFYPHKPTISAMLRILEKMCDNYICEKDSAIASLSMERRWSDEPRLEMIITELYGEEKADQK